MDAVRNSFRWTVWLLMPFFGAIAAPSSNCAAAESCACRPSYRPLFDGTTLCAWRRTWHGPNALATPLNGYYIPRVPACCDYDVYGGGCGDAVADSCLLPGTFGCHDRDSADNGYPPEAGIGFEPVHLERLGQLSNDLELSAGLPAASPSRPGR